MSRVGIRELKNQLSRYLEDVERGKRIGVTRHGKVIAYLVPAGQSPEASKLAGMVEEGLAAWSGGSPIGSRNPLEVEGKPVSEIILEERE